MPEKDSNGFWREKLEDGFDSREGRRADNIAFVRVEIENNGQGRKQKRGDRCAKNGSKGLKGDSGGFALIS